MKKRFSFLLLSLIFVLDSCEPNSSSSVLSSLNSLSSSTSLSNSSSSKDSSLSTVDSSSSTNSSTSGSSSLNSSSSSDSSKSSSNISISSEDSKSSSTDTNSKIGSIEFGTVTKDTSNGDGIETVAKINNIDVQSISTSKVYFEENCALKMGSSSNQGQITFNFKNEINILSAKVYAINYKKDETTLTLSNSSNYTSSKDVNFTSFDDGSLDYENIGVSSYIKLNSSKRCFVSKIEIVYKLDSSSTSQTSSSTSSSSSSTDSSSSSSSSSSSIASSSSSSSSLSSSNTSYDSSDYNQYYSSITDSMTGGLNGTLRVALTSLIKPKGSYSYSGTGANTLSSILQEADEDPSNSDNMIYFYTQDSVKKNAASSWNREHAWPQSLSGGLYGKTGAGCDILHIRPTYNQTNSTRGNHKYGEVSHTSSTSKYYNGKLYGYLSGDIFEPTDEVKGDCARITLYMWVCYFADRNTPITNNATSIQTMVKWANQDQPSAIEKHRNQVAYNSKQKNRNPFVDHPEWVNKIFG